MAGPVISSTAPDTAVLAESIGQANQYANNTIVDSLVKTLKQDPIMDLTSPSAQKKGTESCAGHESDVPFPATKDKEWSEVLLKSDNIIQVDYALDARVLCLACPDHPDSHGTVASFPTENGLCAGDFTAGLNTALWQGDILWRLSDTAVVGLSASMVVKISTSLDPDGITNLQYINKHLPSVPAPTFLGSITCGRRSYVFMSRGRGVTLEALWPDLSTENKIDVQTQLSAIFRDLRRGPAVPHSQDITGARQDVHAIQQAPHLGSFVSVTCKDTRRIQRVSDVPIRNESAFNDFLIKPPPPRRVVPATIRMLRPVMRDDHAIVMTHADLHPRNIMAEWVPALGDLEGEAQGENMAKKRCVITCIIDWDMAGWYPEYWEFVKTLCNASPRGPLRDWPEYLPKDAIGEWPVEYALDSLLGRWLW